jgi:hypothetical protein
MGLLLARQDVFTAARSRFIYEHAQFLREFAVALLRFGGGYLHCDGVKTRVVSLNMTE